MAKKFETLVKREKASHADKLLSLRRHLGWSQKRLAEEFLVSPGTVALWELGKREVPGPALKLIQIYKGKLSLGTKQ